jgi:hypothetical protein
MTITKLANVKIWKKLTLLVAIGIASVVGIGGLCLWALGAIHGTVEQQQIEADKMMSAQRVGSDLGFVNAIVGHITLSQHCENCHATALGGNRAEQVRLAKESRFLMSELKTRDTTTEGQKLAGQLERAGTAWLDANLHVLELGQAGKRGEALTVFREDSIPSVGRVQRALAGYLSFQQDRVAVTKGHADRFESRMPIPIGRC